jgi:hypothetical protein
VSTTLRVLTGQPGVAGDLVLPRVLVTSTNACILQSVIDGLNLWLGEWFLDQNDGFPWPQILGNPPNVKAAFAALRKFLLSVQGIVSVVVGGNYNSSKRALAFNYSAQLANGAILTGGSATPPSISGGN